MYLTQFLKLPSVQKAFKITLIPTHNQQVLINKTIGCARFVY
ncbi:MAG: helix-turn-helix domain-containing protein, partial [Nostoc sp.]